jgi:hypothetical protein
MGALTKALALVGHPTEIGPLVCLTVPFPSSGKLVTGLDVNNVDMHPCEEPASPHGALAAVML